MILFGYLECIEEIINWLVIGILRLKIPKKE